MKLIILSVLVFMAIAISQVNAATKTSYYTSCSATTSILDQYTTADCAAATCTQSNTTGIFNSMECATMPTTVSSGRLLATMYSDSSCSGTPKLVQSFALGACINLGESSVKASCSQIIYYSDTACKVDASPSAVTIGSCTANNAKYQCSGVDKIKMSFMVLVALIAAMFML